MPDTHPLSPRPRARRVSRKLAGLRAKRMLLRLREGRSHRAIAEEEGLTVQRVREIVKRALREPLDDPAVLQAEAEILRLAPALALAEARIADGDLAGVRALIELQKRLDLYRAVTGKDEEPSSIAESRAAAEKVTRLLLQIDPERPQPETMEEMVEMARQRDSGDLDASL